jgi:hypothetical protein
MFYFNNSLKISIKYLLLINCQNRPCYILNYMVIYKVFKNYATKAKSDRFRLKWVDYRRKIQGKPRERFLQMATK